MNMRTATCFGAWWCLIALWPSSTAAQSFGVLLEGKVAITRASLVTQAVTLANGRIVINGTHDRIDGKAHRGLALLEADGRLIDSFRPDCQPLPLHLLRPACFATARALPSGGFVLVGSFTTIDGVSVRHVARFDGNGVLDPSFQALAATPDLLPTRVIGSDGTWLWFEGRIGATPVLRRIALAGAGTVDPSWGDALGAQIFSSVVDQLGRVFELLTDQASMTTVLRRRTSSGVVDAGWTPIALNFSGPLRYDVQTDKLFVAVTDGNGVPASIVRIDPDSGLDPSWAPVIPSDADRAAALSILGQAPGQLVTGLGRNLIMLHDASSGALIATRPLASGIRLAAASAAGSWIVAPIAADEPSNLNGSAVARWTVDLQNDPSFVGNVRGVGNVLAAALDPSDASIVLGGDFSRIDGVSKRAIARLNSGFAIAPQWPHGVMPLVFGPDTVLDQIAISPAGRLVSTSTLPPNTIPWPGLNPIMAVATSSLAQVRYWQSPRPFALDRAENIYTIDPSCRALFPGRPDIARVPLAELTAPTVGPPPWCNVDPSWAVPHIANRSITRLALSADGMLYFVERPATGFSSFIRRIATAPNALVDPSWMVELAPPAGVFMAEIVRAMLIDGPHIYLSGGFALVGGVPASGLVRIDRASGALDLSWPAAPSTASVVSIAIDDTWVYSVGITASIPGAPSVGEIRRRHKSDGRDDRAIFSSGGDSSTPTLPRGVIALGDGRAVVFGDFDLIDGLPRDGFAVVGTAQVLYEDGFEAP